MTHHRKRRSPSAIARRRSAARGLLDWRAARALRRDGDHRRLRRALPVARRPACGLLSGGNMQKLILGRALDRRARASSSPTSRPAASTSAPSPMSIAGCSRRATRGAAVLLISEDLDEILALADRIVVMFAGRLSAPLGARRAHGRASSALLMAGHGSEAGACGLSPPAPSLAGAVACPARGARSPPWSSRRCWCSRPAPRPSAVFGLVAQGRGRLAIRVCSRR